MKVSKSILAVLLFSMVFQSCAAITGIFKAGVWVGLLLVVGVVLLLMFVFGRKK
jgi:hypothetical protein